MKAKNLIEELKHIDPESEIIVYSHHKKLTRVIGIIRLDYLETENSSKIYIINYNESGSINDD